MTISKAVLTISLVITTVADAVHKHLVVPTLRTSAKLKAKGLDLAFQEADNKYWDAVDEALAARKYLTSAEQNIKARTKQVDNAQKAIRTFSKSQGAI